MIKRINNIAQLEITITPSEKDIRLKTLEQKIRQVITLPQEFLMGQHWEATLHCIKCNQPFTFHRNSSNFFNLSFLSNYDITDLKFLDDLSSPFRRLQLQDKQVNENRIYNYYLSIDAIAKVFLTHCSHCGENYLGSYAEKFGGDGERGPSSLTPDFVYIEEIVQVQINRTELIEKYKSITK